MMALVLVAQLVIIWVLINMSLSISSLKKRINRASRHLEMTDKPEDPKPICGCQHHQCFHDENGGGCGYNHNKYNDGAWKSFACNCKRYTGPEALPTVLP